MDRVLFHITLILTLVVGIFSHSSVASNSTRFVTEKWSTESGLSHNTISAISQTDDKYVWFSSWEGVDRFNGHEFVNIENIYNVPVEDNAARSLTINQQGDLFVGGAKGQLLVRNSDGKWRELYRFKSQVNFITPSPLHYLVVATEDQQVYGLSSSGQLFNLTEQQPLSGVITGLSVYEDQVLISTTAGLFFVQDQTIDSVNSLQNTTINHIYVKEESVFLATEKGVLHVQNSDLSDSKWIIEDKNVLTFSVDRQGRFWCGTAKDGLIVYHPDGQVDHFNNSNHLLDNRVTTIFEDVDGSVWVGTVGGLTRFFETDFNAISKADGLPANFTRAVLEDHNGTMWLGTSNGLAQFDPNTDAIESQALLNQSILSLALSQSGDILAGSYTDGVFVRNKGRFESYLTVANGLPSNQIRSIETRIPNQIWVGTSEGIAVVETSSNKVTQVIDQNQGLKNNAVAVVKIIKDTVWVGTSRGVNLIKKGQVVEKYNLAGIQPGHIFDFYYDEQADVVFIASDTGLYRYRYRDDSLAQLPEFNYQNVAKFFTILKDEYNYLWLSSNVGIYRVERDILNAHLDGKLVELKYDVFEESEGLLSKQANGRSTPAGWLDTRGQVWFATSKGAVRANTGDLATYKPVDAAIKFEAVSVDLALQDLSSDIVLQPDAKHLKVKFSSINLVSPKRTVYRVRLTGFQDEWDERGQTNTIEYTNLPPGRYLLEVSSSIAPYEWSVPKQMTIVKLPYWWQTNVFKVVSILGLLVCLWLSLYWRSYRARLRQKILQQQVDEKTKALQIQSSKLLKANQEKSELLKQLVESSKVLKRLSNEDALTELLNRRAFSEKCEEWQTLADRHGAKYCIGFFDIDYFKSINDNWSHSAGDAALKSVADTLKNTLREQDIIARWGGEEFIVLFPETSLDTAYEMAEKLRKAVYIKDNEEIAEGLTITISGGVASSENAHNYEQVIHRADMALFESKQFGRNKMNVFYPDAPEPGDSTKLSS